MKNQTIFRLLLIVWTIGHLFLFLVSNPVEDSEAVFYPFTNNAVLQDNNPSIEPEQPSKTSRVNLAVNPASHSVFEVYDYTELLAYTLIPWLIYGSYSSRQRADRRKRRHNQRYAMRPS